MKIVSQIASITTLSLATLGIIGKIWYVKKILKKKDISFDVSYDKMEGKLDENERLYINCDSFLNYIKIYQVTWSENHSEIVDQKLIYEKENISSSQTLIIDCDIDGEFPKYLLEYEKEDYIKGELLLRASEKTKGIDKEHLNQKVSFKTILYHFFQ